MKFGLNLKAIEQLNSLFKKYAVIDEVIIYGSRAKGTFRNGSDIDITLKGEGLTEQDLSRLDSDIDDLLLPYTVDLSIMSKIDNPDLVDHITRVGKRFYKK